MGNLPFSLQCLPLTVPVCSAAKKGVLSHEKNCRADLSEGHTVCTGACTLKQNGERCENIIKIIQMMEKQNISITEKTHDL